MDLSALVLLWDKGGQDQFLNQVKEDVDNSSADVQQHLYQLVVLYLDGKLKPEKVLATLEKVITFGASISYIVGDVFNLCDMDVTGMEDRRRMDHLYGLISDSTEFIPSSVLKQTLDVECMEKIGLVREKKSFDQKYVRIKTRIYYKQQKFNLLREESEGYAKLVTELSQDFATVDVQYLKQVVQSLIGFFNLDPNRVLDVLLECLEARPTEWRVMTDLIRHQARGSHNVTHLLGFKYLKYKGEKETPTSLHTSTALLVHADLVDSDLLYPHLSPSDDQMEGLQGKLMSEAKQYTRKVTTVLLGEKKEEEAREVLHDSAADMLEWNNQKLGLCQALVKVGSLEKARKMVELMPPHLPAAHPAFASAVCSALYTLTAGLYGRFNGLPPPLAKLTTRADSRPQSLVPLPTVTSAPQFEEHVVPLLQVLGAHLSSDPVLLSRLIRICQGLIKECEAKTPRRPGGDTSQTVCCVLSALDEALLPSLSLLTANSCVSEELWGLLKLLPYTNRYNLYGRWKNVSMLHHPLLIRARADCIERSKYLLKRLTKENVKPTGRHIGKISHANPGILFDYALSQIQLYDNYIGPMVDALKYLTSLSYDVLAFCLIEALSSPEKEKMKTDETNISAWLNSLSQFAGQAFKKYSIDLTGLLQYVLNQLKMGKSTDLSVVREVVQKMSGIEIADEVTDDQLDALAGGEMLKQEGAYFAQVRNTKRSSARLKEALLGQELAVPACLLISQQRDCILYREMSNRSHVKLVARLYDQCQDTVDQLGTFLASQLSSGDFSRRLPPVNEMIMTYHVPPDAAFFFARAGYSHAIAAKFDELRKEKKKSNDKVQRYLTAVDHVMPGVVEAVRPTKEPGVWEDLNADFYVMFWSLTSYDLEVPREAYTRQIQQLQTTMAQADRNKDLSQTKKKKEKERCQGLIDKLKDEMKKQADHKDRVLARLNRDKETWFPNLTGKTEMVAQFLQHCVFPRSCFTASDAIYCARFIHTLHSIKTPNFSTLILVDRIFNDITYSMTSCTENEVNRFGRFLNAMLQIIMRWHSSKDIFDKECYEFPGFITMIRKGVDNSPHSNPIDYENFRHVCHKWHFRTTKAMASCLESGNYIQIRNALVVLTKILPNFPRIVNYAQAIERRVDRVAKDEKSKRPDLYALAVGYCGQLKQKKANWVSEGDFHIKEKPKPAPVDSKASKAAGKEGKTPKAAASKSDTKADKVKAEPKSKAEAKEKSKVEGKDKSKSEGKKQSGKKGEDKSRTNGKDSPAHASLKKELAEKEGPMEPPESPSRVRIKQDPVSPSRDRSASREKKTSHRKSSPKDDEARGDSKRRKVDSLPSVAVKEEWVEKPRKEEKRAERKRTGAEKEGHEVKRHKSVEDGNKANGEGDRPKLLTSEKKQREKRDKEGHEEQHERKERSSSKKKK